MKLAGKLGTMVVIAALLSGVAASATRAAQPEAGAPITRSEALTQAAARFDAADANGDGVLSVEERREGTRPSRQR